MENTSINIEAGQATIETHDSFWSVRPWKQVADPGGTSIIECSPAEADGYGVYRKRKGGMMTFHHTDHNTFTEAYTEALTASREHTLAVS